MKTNDRIEQFANAYLALCRAWIRGESAVPPPPYEQFINELKRMNNQK